MKYAVTVAGQTMEIDVAGDTVRVDGRRLTANLVGIPQTPLRRLVVDGRAQMLAMLRRRDGWTVQLAGESWDLTVVDERTWQLRSLAQHRPSRSARGVVKAPMPGLVLRVEVELGQVLDAGAGVVVLEAMKMENEIKTPTGGVVRAINVAPGQAVEKGVPLVELGQ